MIKKRNNGVWRLDVKLPNGERCRKSLGTTDKAEALLKAPAALQAALDEAQHRAPSQLPKTAPKPSTILLKDAFKKAMKDHPRWRDSKAQRTIEDNFDLICRSSLFNEEDDLTTVTYAKCSDYVEQLQQQGTSASTINQRLSLLSVLLTYAASKWGFTQITPFKMPRQKPPKGRIRVLSREEEASVISRFSIGLLKYHKDMADLVACLVDTGCRLSEMLRLNIRDVSWEQNVVLIWENKGDQPRSVPMTSRVRTLLARRASIKEPFGMLTVDSADNCWEWVRKEMGLKGDKEFVIHSLRHTTASRLAAKGMDAFRIQKWMGHKNIATTMIYVTLYGRDLQALADALEYGPEAVPIGGLSEVSTTGVRTDEPYRHPGGGGTVNPQVPGSSPGRGARILKGLRANVTPFLFSCAGSSIELPVRRLVMA